MARSCRPPACASSSTPERSSASSRLRRSATRLFRERCGGTNRRDAGRGRGRLGREHRRARPRGRRGGDRPRGYIKVDSQLRTTAPGIYAARRHRAPHGRARGRARGLPRRDQRHRRKHRGPSRGGQPSGQLHRPGIRLCRDSARRPLARPMTSSWGLRASAPCRARSSTVAPGFCKLVVDRGNHAILGCHIVGEGRRTRPAGRARGRVRHEGRAARAVPSRSPPTPTCSDAQRSERAPARSRLGSAGRGIAVAALDD